MGKAADAARAWCTLHEQGNMRMLVLNWLPSAPVKLAGTA
jgi:hypothetical protein